MEVLHNNKIMFAFLVASIISYAYYKYDNVDTEEKKNKDNIIYIFVGVFFLIYISLYMTEDNIDNVFEHIEHGDPDF
jgi:ascorbate-specific PTS system EIIC-type component UlaA|tara:strand:- start:510 stop:740 length:231 start_codon:yes stop_codon:yes gene_type:complete